MKWRIGLDGHGQDGWLERELTMATLVWRERAEALEPGTPGHATGKRTRKKRKKDVCFLT